VNDDGTGPRLVEEPAIPDAPARTQTRGNTNARERLHEAPELRMQAKEYGSSACSR